MPQKMLLNFLKQNIKITKMEFDLTNSLAQFWVADWAVDAMDGLAKEDQEELWGKSFEGSPVKLEDKTRKLLFIVNDKEVIDDFLYRIEVQYIRMAKDESKKDYENSLRSVMLLSNKIRFRFNMNLLKREDLTI